MNTYEVSSKGIVLAIMHGDSIAEIQERFEATVTDPPESYSVRRTA